MEQATSDFSDAFCHVMVHPDEHKNNLVARPPRAGNKVVKRGRPEIALMVRLGFGSNGGPLIWSRFAAAMGRMGQAILRPKCIMNSAGTWTSCRSQVRIYLDDPIFSLAGTGQQRWREMT